MASYLAHSSHHHMLVRTQNPSQGFICDVCQSQGNGVRYRCDACDFDLDERCAKLDETKSFLQYPGHNLSLDADSYHPGSKHIITSVDRDQNEKEMPNSLTHFTHHHQLVKTDLGPDQIFGCDVCQYPGVGAHYRCNACDFDLHESCAKLPETMSFFAHPGHNLRLASGHSRLCDLCMQSGEGFFYRCIDCNFDVHPHCTTIQQVVRTALHTEHSLSLVAGVYKCSSAACDVINGVWFYRCAKFNVSFHINCLHGPINPMNDGEQTAHHNADADVDASNNGNNTTGGRARARQFVQQVTTQAVAGTIANALADLFLQQ